MNVKFRSYFKFFLIAFEDAIEVLVHNKKKFCPILNHLATEKKKKKKKHQNMAYLIFSKHLITMKHQQWFNFSPILWYM